MFTYDAVKGGTATAADIEAKEALYLERWLLKKCRNLSFRDILPGEAPETRVNYCPWWVPALWMMRDLKIDPTSEAGIDALWHLWDVDYYQGLGEIAVRLWAVLIDAESRAARLLPQHS